MALEMERTLKDRLLVRFPHLMAGKTEVQKGRTTKGKSLWQSRDTKYGQWSGNLAF